MPDLHVHLLPSLTTAEQLAGATVVVIDVLRATTTIVTALANGATVVRPSLDIDDALAIVAKYGSQYVALGGERAGLKIDGFQFGNSPAEYTAAAIAGKTLAFTTTNGTRAMALAKSARRVLIGAAVNLTAVAKSLIADDNVHLLCAGTDGHITAEDVIVAGLLVRQLVAQQPHRALNDEAQLALLAVAEVQCAADLVPLFRASRGGRNLSELGMDADIVLCAAVDRFIIVPELNLNTWEIRIAT